MKKITMIGLFCGLAWMANAQLTTEQIAQKMRPEYRVDLRKTATSTTSVTSTSKQSITPEQLQQDITALEAQNAKLDEMAAERQRNAPQATADNDAMLNKYRQAKSYNNACIERNRQMIVKLKAKG